MSLVVDASVLVKWFVDEEGRSDALRLRPVVERLATPDFALVELANIAWKKVRRGEMAAEDSDQLVPVLRRSPLRLVPTEALLGPAILLARELDHPVYDCLYVALTDLLSAPLITADLALLRRLAATRFAGRAHALAEVGRLLDA